MAAGEWREDGQDVAGAELELGRRVAPVDEGDAFEVDGDAEALDDVVNRAGLGNVEGRRAFSAARWQEQGQGGEEADLDPHR
jgi:hypothetical protein